jgi:lysophospholipase L1-like esterase
MPPAAPLANQTLRLVVHPHIAGGSAIRIRLSNVFGDRQLTIGEATVARQTSGASVDAASVRPLTYAGLRSVTIPQGGEVVSDPVPYTLAAGRDLAVDLYLPLSTGVPTGHLEARQTSYISTAGDHVGSTSLPVGSTMTSWDFLTDVEVLKPLTRGLITFGDSLTDGTGSTLDADHRYPDYLATALAAQPATRDISVVDAGIGGGRLLHNRIGPNALDRFDRDVLSKPSPSYVLVQIGINDIGVADLLDPTENVTADQIIQGYQQLITRAHARGLAIYCGTLLPIEGSIYNSPAHEQKREDVNNWLRSTAGKPGGFDKVGDFDAVIRDPADSARILSAYDSGDHLHLNDTGYATMANAAAALFVAG